MFSLSRAFPWDMTVCWFPLLPAFSFWVVGTIFELFTCTSVFFSNSALVIQENFLSHFWRTYSFAVLVWKIHPYPEYLILSRRFEKKYFWSKYIYLPSRNLTASLFAGIFSLVWHYVQSAPFSAQVYTTTLTHVNSKTKQSNEGHKNYSTGFIAPVL